MISDEGNLQGEDYPDIMLNTMTIFLVPKQTMETYLRKAGLIETEKRYRTKGEKVAFFIRTGINNMKNDASDTEGEVSPFGDRCHLSLWLVK